MAVHRNQYTLRITNTGGPFTPPVGDLDLSTVIARAGNDSGYWNITVTDDSTLATNGDLVNLTILNSVGSVLGSATVAVGNDITTTVTNDNNWVGGLANYITPTVLSASALNAGTQLIQFNKAKWALDSGKLGFFKGEELNFYVDDNPNLMLVQESAFFARSHQFYQGQQRFDVGYTFGDSTLGLPTQYSNSFVVSAIERTATSYGGTLTAPNPLVVGGYAGGTNRTEVNDVNVPTPGDKIGEWVIQDDLSVFPEPFASGVTLTHGLRRQSNSLGSGMLPIPIVSVDTTTRTYNVQAFTSNIAVSGPVTGNTGMYRGNNAGDSSLDPLNRTLLFSDPTLPGATFNNYDFVVPDQGTWFFTLYSGEGRFNTSWSSDTELIHADFIMNVFEF